MATVPCLGRLCSGMLLSLMTNVSLAPQDAWDSLVQNNVRSGSISCIVLEDMTAKPSSYVPVLMAVVPRDSIEVDGSLNWHQRADTRRLYSGRDGRVVWDNIPAGSYRVHAASPGYEGIFEPVQVVAGSTTGIVYQLQKPRGMTTIGTVTRSDSAR